MKASLSLILGNDKLNSLLILKIAFKLIFEKSYIYFILAGIPNLTSEGKLKSGFKILDFTKADQKNHRKNYVS
jgi:hypothetical protein